MSYCLNPNCPKPQNSEVSRFCINCGTNLLLKDRYRAVKPIGQGGFGRTFLAADEYKPSKRRCVIKQFFPQAQGTNNVEKAAALFEQEAVRLDDLGNHPQIPELLAYFTEDNRQYLVQEFIEGQNLAEALAESGAFSEAQIRDLLNNLLPVLEFIHSQNVIHRDIKPENIIFRTRSVSPFAKGGLGGDLVLVDFGAAKYATETALLKTGTKIGSLEYMAPEQIRGKAVFASDLYSLGVTCIHLLTGVSPFDLFDTNEDAWVWRHRLGNNPISDELGCILDKLIENATKKRYQSTAEVLKDLNPQPAALRLIVSKLGQADYRTIGEAIANAQPGTRILVRPGIYNEGLIIDKSVEIVGDGSLADIIIDSRDSDCILMQTDYAVVRGLTLRRRAALNGNEYYAVDIPQGRLVLEDCDITSDSLSCVAIHGATANPAIRRCQIHDGKSGGVYVYENGTGTVEDCDIFGNAYVGVEIKQGGNPLIRRCQIHDGKSAGVYVWENGTGTVEDCDIFGNAYAGVAINQGGNPLIRRCQIHDGKACGVYVGENGTGTVEECDIFGNAKVGVEIKQGGNPLIHRCQIHDGKSVGVYVWENGTGTVEDCDIFGNALLGVGIKQGGNPVIRRCRINRNGYQAVWVYDNGAGTIENCDLTNNTHGAWNVESGCQVQRSGNTE